MDRRSFLESCLGALAAPALVACGLSEPKGGVDLLPQSRLTARPGEPTEDPPLGLSALGLGGGRDGVLYVPTTYSGEPIPLFVALHGAGQSASLWQSYPDRAQSRGFVLLAPDSRGSTWDAFSVGWFGPDVRFLDEALKYTFARCRIDPTRLLLGGFSDGASYALSLGPSNGDLFTHLVGYSPGIYSPPGPVVGQPRVWISHGTLDPVLPFAHTRDQIVPALRRENLDVTFQEFDGGHEVPKAISDAALDWFFAP